MCVPWNLEQSEARKTCDQRNVNIRLGWTLFVEIKWMANEYC